LYFAVEAVRKVSTDQVKSILKKPREATPEATVVTSAAICLRRGKRLYNFKGVLSSFWSTLHLLRENEAGEKRMKLAPGKQKSEQWFSS
jgi:hypothetical protein